MANQNFKYTCSWSVPNVFLCKEYGGYDINYSFVNNSHYSGRYTGKDELSWDFMFKTNYYQASVYLFFSTAEKQPIRAKYVFSILKDKKIIYSKEGTDIFYANKKKKLFQNPKGINNFITSDGFYDLFFKSSNASSDEGIYACNLSLETVLTLEYPRSEKGKFIDISKCTLLQDITNLQGDKDLSDIVLRVKGQEFHCHKVILALRSPVFNSIFQSKLTENSQNEVNVEDIDPEVFELLLTYIYTGKIEIKNDLSKGLLYAAKKYNLPRLKAACEKALANELTVENVIDILLMADAHSATQLKDAALDFIEVLPQDVSKTEQWDEMLCTRPDLTKECLNTIIMKK